ncbi:MULTISPECIES: DUF1501 domain-containing protein [unclassified Novosphingobium]|uniref:DUF1501 domain-containing protein n=1 Tax=unclassified Novosphingobium TaxID=2644732 RepID=UPI00146DAD92|nr:MULTISPECIES: DUF1501 domain-containing protein [unclassified Novosphingobium]NMN04531.1 uncharacterized protein (DUF1501 family) [Novosphingobium sp. SG919]NMN85477.1 uncharacterized protein (DUF1501 family) [Novosphingobium sp. SG916]
MLHRRHFLSFAGIGAGTLLVAPHMALAAVETERRFVFIIQRGAADGLNIVVPYADPAYASLRGALAIDPAAAIRLDGTFALHPALKETAGMFAQKQAMFVHAVASPYRDRSHFDGQNVLETGGTQAYQVKDGWLNRLVTMLPKARDTAIAIAPTVPAALRGPMQVTSYAPSGLPTPSDDLMLRVGQLYAQDSQLHPAWAAALDARQLADGSGAKQDPASLGRLTASFLTKPHGPRIAMLETGGWDTHSGQEGRLANQLKALDSLLAALRDGLGPVWNQTTVLVATEFGRTAAANGTGGTDHGTGSVAWVLGGAVKGGRVIADWPGLANNQLYENRDLRPTAALDALIAGLAAESLGLDPDRVARRLFPLAGSPRPLTGLVGALPGVA